jgi:hypothetical protein
MIFINAADPLESNLITCHVEFAFDIIELNVGQVFVVLA